MGGLGVRACLTNTLVPTACVAPLLAGGRKKAFCRFAAEVKLADGVLVAVGRSVFLNRKESWLFRVSAIDGATGAGLTGIATEETGTVGVLEGNGVALAPCGSDEEGGLAKSGVDGPFGLNDRRGLRLVDSLNEFVKDTVLELGMNGPMSTHDCDMLASPMECWLLVTVLELTGCRLVRASNSISSNDRSVDERAE